MKRTLISKAVLVVLLGTGAFAQAQIPAPPPAPQAQLRPGPELDQMLGPIALYPDPLIAQLLPAATLPSEIVMADRYVNGGGDPNLIDQQPWDASVKALARYPTILKWMDDNLAWTTAVGQAFLYQQQDVMDSIQRLRAQAMSLGNLQSTPQENVITDNGTIEILPANPQVIYVPVYQPDLVYYQRSLGVPFISFGLGLPVGLWLSYDLDWHNHHLIVWGHDHPRPGDWWSRRPGERPRIEVGQTRVWEPRYHPALPASGMDRGWGAGPARAPVTTFHSPVTVIGAQPRLPERREGLAPAPRRSGPVAIQRPASGSLIGIQSAPQTRQFSARGQQSRQVGSSRPAAAPARSAPAAHSAAPNRGGKH